MSARELTRVEVLARVKAGALTVKAAAVLMRVGYRQAKRLVQRYRARGRRGCGMAAWVADPIARVPTHSGGE